jgi:transposase InsO family protein
VEHVNAPIIRNKLGLLNLAQELGNVSKACKVMGLSRDTFYRYRAAHDSGGVEALIDKSRRKPNHKNRTDETTEAAVVAFATDFPAYGQVRASNELRKQGVFISPSGVRCVWLRHELASFEQRLVALERKMAESGGLVLTEAQVQALERKREDDVACGEIETVHPGYLGSQDTFYVGTMKGVGRIYQQTFVDTYSKWVAAKLYTTKRPITSADLLNDRVLPFFQEQGMGMLRILTDRGTEFCGKAEQHDYELFLAVNEIEHTKTKARHPQTNGICERFHKTVLQEFYQVTFRKNIYRSIEELQIDLDAWIDHYNTERTHQGKMCCGRTPMATMLAGKEIWNEKVAKLNANA